MPDEIDRPIPIYGGPIPPPEADSPEADYSNIRAAPAYGCVPPPEEYVPSEVCVALYEINPDNKILTIKTIREITGWDLSKTVKITKAVENGTPQLVKSNISRADGEDLVRKLDEVDARGGLITPAEAIPFEVHES